MASHDKKLHYSSKKKQKNIPAVETNITYLLPIIFVIAVLPLIVKLHKYSANLSQYKWFTVDDTSFDFFLYYKQAFLIATAVVMLILIVYNAYKTNKAIPFHKIFIPLGVYAFFAFLSSVVSEYRAYSLSGSFEQFESVFALLSYCLLVYYAYLFIVSERALKIIIYALLISVFVLIFIGLTQVTGHDFYNTQTGWSLISDSTFKNYKDSFTISAGLNRVYLSIYNPNYVGVYVSLVFPIIFYMILFTKKLWLKLVFLVALIGLAICLYGSQSTTGFISVVVTVVISMAFLWRYFIKYFYLTIPVILISIVGLFIVNAQTNNYIGYQINKITNIQKSTPTLTDIQTNEDNLTIKYSDNTLKITFDIDEFGSCNFLFKDQNDNFVTSQFDTINGPVNIVDERFPGFIFTPVQNGDVIGFETFIDGQTWFFTNQYEDNAFYYFNSYGRYDKIVNAPSAIFTGYEQYASGRGYIWSRTIPLLKDKIILGSGADSFTLVFPQNDYVNSKTYGFGTQLMSKPHSLYLQIAVQTGVLSLLAFLVFYGIYFVTSIKLYITCRYHNFSYIVGASIFVSTIGYMISGITNDSSITVAPVFWALIGIGIAINHKLKHMSIV